MSKIKVDELVEAINGELEEYVSEIKQGVSQDLETTGKECLKKVKELSPKRTGAYRRSWAMRKITDDGDVVNVTIYNRKHYRLTSWLENGHLCRDGSRTEGKPHIRPAQEAAAAALERRIKITVERVGQ
nr:MAG TPA_asm: putative tail component [Caudoviricetes sp.]